MARSPDMKLFDSTLAKVEAGYDEMIERARIALDAERQTHRLTIAQSEKRVADLENELELCQYFERERQAARVRQELAVATEQHKTTVRVADQRLQKAMLHYLRGYSAAATAMEAAFNSAVS